MFKNLKNIKFKETVQVNFLRGLAAGIVWTIIFLIWSPEGMSIGIKFAYPIVIPLVYLLAIIPIASVIELLMSVGIPYIGLVTIIFAFMVIPGDPVMFVIHKVRPAWIPVEKYPFIGFVYCILVLKPGTQLLK